MLLAGLGLSLSIGLAPAEVLPSVEVEWSAPPECGTRDAVIAQTEALLGRPLGHPDDPELELRAEVSGDANSGYQLQLVFIQPVVRQRVLVAETCVELQAAVSTILAVTLDPLATLNEPEPEPEPQTPPEPRAELELPTEPEPQTPPEPEPPFVSDEARVRGFVRVAGGLTYPILPQVAGGPAVAIGLGWRALRAELVGSLWLSGQVRYPLTPEVGAQFMLGWVTPRVCVAPRAGPLHIPLCAGVELGGVRGTGFGTPDARSRTLAWIAIEAGAALEMELNDQLALWLGVDAIAPLTRPGFSFAGLGELHRVPGIAFAALLGLQYEFAGSK